jgi:iron complex outermembrane receptor protein
MKKFRKSSSIPALIAGLVLGGQSAVAAETPASNSAVTAKENLIEEVVVTARRREESLQVVPISVTAISGEALASKGVTNAFDLGDHVPSLRIQASELSPRLFTTSIRGLKSLNYLVLDDSPIGTYFAEGVVAHPYGFGASFFDLQSVQVLKGPQGTLFGRNTTGGAVLIEPNKASIDAGSTAMQRWRWATTT